jgi:hypothetical protein
MIPSSVVVVPSVRTRQISSPKNSGIAQVTHRSAPPPAMIPATKNTGTASAMPPHTVQKVEGGSPYLAAGRRIDAVTRPMVRASDHGCQHHLEQ